MNKVLQFGVPNNTEISNEIVGSILLHINPQTSAPAVATISNLNKIKFGLKLKRAGQQEISQFDGYLGEFLQILYGGTTKLETVLQSTSIGYLFSLEFKNRYDLGKNDVLTVTTDLGNANSAFTNAVNADSTAVIYTNPSATPNPQRYTSIWKSYPVGSGETDFDKVLGNNVAKIVIDSHPTATFDANNDAKPTRAELFADGGYHEEKSHVELLAENEMMLNYNPDTEVKNLVQYQGQLLNGVRAKIKFDAQANSHTKVLVQSYIIT